MGGRRMTYWAAAVALVVSSGCVTRLRRVNRELWNEKSRLEQELAQARGEQETLRQAVADRDQRLAGLQNTERQLQDRETEIAQLRSANQATQEELARLKAAGQNTQQEMNRLRQALAGLDVEVAERGGLMAIVIKDDVRFGFAQDTLTEAGKTLLKGIARVINQRYPTALIRVDGHTDNVPVKRTASRAEWGDNWGLGAERALNVLRYLVKECGVKADRIYASSFGQYRPTASNRLADGRARNRRVELVILPGKT